MFSYQPESVLELSGYRIFKPEKMERFKFLCEAGSFYRGAAMMCIMKKKNILTIDIPDLCKERWQEIQVF